MKKNYIKIGIIFFLLSIVIILNIKYNNEEEQIIAEVESNFGTTWVFDTKELRCMSFLKPPTPIIQSCMNKNNHKIISYDYARLFTSTVFFVDNPRKILVIGLGGATIQRAFNAILPRTHIDTVEINSTLPSLVEKYFDYKEDNLNKIIIDDGARFAKNGKEAEYDIILIDAFSSDYIPPQMLTDDFMQNVKRMLTENGVVAINTFANSDYTDLEIDLFKRNFDNYFKLLAGSSKVMIAGKNSLPSLAEVSANANLWRFRFIEIGVDQYILLNFFKSTSS